MFEEQVGKVITCRNGANVNTIYKWQITRSAPSLPKGWTWKPALSPSKALFYKYLNWRDKNKWPIMWPEYVRIFNEDALCAEFQEGLDQAVNVLLHGNDLAISCFCQIETQCHRSLVKPMIEERLSSVLRRID